MENKYIENGELEQLRNQMALLEKKLADQEIVNDRLIQDSMKDKLAWIRKYVILEMIAVPVIILIWAGISVFARIPLWVTAVMLVGCVVDVYYDWKINVTPIKENDFDRQNLIETAQKLREMKRLRCRQTIIGSVAVMLIFVIVGVYVYLNNFKDADLLAQPSLRSSALIGGCVGLGIGIVVGAIAIWQLFKKMQRSNDELINRIEALTGEE